MDRPLLTTKLHVPALRANLVPRPRLVERLNDGLRDQHRLILVCAPAGFGKTTLLGEWIQSLPEGEGPAPRVAWITLDEGDNDPARFSAYLVAALRQLDEAVGQASTGALALAGSLLHEAQLVELINQLAALPQTLILALDDYHRVTSQVIHDAVTFLIDHLSENLHLVLATRGDPPLPLPRLRARGQLTELRQSDLRFTATEAAAFLNDVMGLDLWPEDMDALEARTEGWIAGLQMAALSLQAQPPDLTGQARSEFIRAFAGSHRFVLDYLVEEVLERQPPALQQFLLKTSILERLTGALCDAVLGDELPVSDFAGSQAILEHLEDSSLFIVPLDHQRQWYRYHRLFADLLQQRLARSLPDSLAALHRRASAWHEQHGLMAEAIDHALAAGDHERAAALIEESVEATLMRSEITTFLNWVDRMPDESVRRRPTLCFFHAWALLMSGQSLDLVEQRLQDMLAVQESPESADMAAGRLAALRAYLMLFQADMPHAAELCQQAFDLLPESEVFLRNVVAWILSLARLADGDPRDGRQALAEVARMGQESGNRLIAVAALCYQAKLQARQGLLHRAREILERALRLATDFQGRRLPIASEPLIGLGELQREWNHLDAAAGYLTEGLELAGQWSELAAFDAYFPLARVRLAQGDRDGAHQALETAQQIARRSQATEIDDLVAALQLAYLSAMEGDIAAALRWAERRGLFSVGVPERDDTHHLIDARLRKYEQIVLARVLILQGQASEGLALLEVLLAEARHLDRVDLIIEIQILRALAFQAVGRADQAIAALAQALSLAEPGGHLRTFLDEGEPMATLLRQASAQGVAPAYVTQLLAAFGEPAPSGREAGPASSTAQPLVESLSQRELEVLRLLAAGMSNPEIASELVVAVSTVRSHCKSIYGKLNVHSRWGAVARARDLGLI